MICSLLHGNSAPGLTSCPSFGLSSGFKNIWHKASLGFLSILVWFFWFGFNFFGSSASLSIDIYLTISEKSSAYVSLV